MSPNNDPKYEEMKIERRIFPSFKSNEGPVLSAIHLGFECWRIPTFGGALSLQWAWAWSFSIAENWLTNLKTHFLASWVSKSCLLKHFIKEVIFHWHFFAVFLKFSVGKIEKISHRKKTSKKLFFPWTFASFTLSSTTLHTLKNTKFLTCTSVPMWEKRNAWSGH